MKIIVTGADGFVGEYLIPRLIKDKHELFLIGNDIESLKERHGNNNLCLSYIDLDQNKLIDKINKFSPETVIHLAAFSTASDAFTDMENLFSANILFLGKILDALKKTNLKSFIYTGSSTEYSKGDDLFNPAYLYSATKTAGRSILNYYSDIYNFKSIFITPYNVYGGINPKKKIIDLLYDSLNSDSPVDTTKGNQELDFIHIIDLVDLYCKIIDNLNVIPNNTNFKAGTGVGHSLRELAALLERFSGKETNINWGGIPYRTKDTMYAVANISNQKEILNWNHQINLEQGVRMFLETKAKSNKL